MSLYVVGQSPSKEQLLISSEFDARVVAYAILAGVILYLINKSFINNFPPYIAIIIGLVLTIYLGSLPALRFVGVALMADGFYKLIKEYVTINS